MTTTLAATSALGATVPLQAGGSLPLGDWVAVTPVILLGLTALLLFVFDSIDPDSSNSLVLAGTAAVGTVLALGVTLLLLGSGVGRGQSGALSLYGGQLVVDGMALFFTVIFTSVTTLVIIASYDYLRDRVYQAEYYMLMLLAASGMTLMAASGSLATVFVSLELASLPSYALVAFLKDNRGSVEAGLKYFLIGALSSAIFAYGISLVYGVTGQLGLDAIAQQLAGGTQLVGILGVGVLMIAGGFAFKTASVPFHFWAPEAYEGAPAPVSAFLSSASKAAGFVVAFRVFAVAFDSNAVASTVDWTLAFWILAAVTMTIGNFAAATQENVKRMLAYSSVGHAGYVLIGLAALNSGQNGLVLGASMIHLLVYGFMNTGAFLFVALAEYWEIGRTFEDYSGLGTQAPIACVAMSVFMFSLAGLPIGGGFMSKYFILVGAVGTGHFALAGLLLINSALSLYFYSRVVRALWFEDPADSLEISDYPIGLYGAVVGAAVVTFLLLPGIFLASDVAISAASALFV
jgi:proton-translocating NADH-quinone oxidoreductase chain N